MIERPDLAAKWAARVLGIVAGFLVAFFVLLMFLAAWVLGHIGSFAGALS